VTGISYTSLRRLRQHFDSGAKIVSGIRKVLEHRLDVELSDEEVSNVVEWLISDDVNLPFHELANS
jgi:hypothetical protein